MGRRSCALTDNTWGTFSRVTRMFFGSTVSTMTLRSTSSSMPIADGIRDVNTAWLQTMEGARFTTAYDFTNGTSSAVWLNVNTIYADQTTMATNAAHAYAQTTLPFFLIEGRYEYDAGGVTEAQVRLQAYQVMLGGGTGQLLGNQNLWSFPTGWQTTLGSPGAMAEANAWNFVLLPFMVADGAEWNQCSACK